jgi:arylsulfatase
MSETTPDFLAYRRPPDGAPNILLVVLDDVGFAQLGCYGSPIETPHIDRLAGGGLRYQRFHVTAICSSTRAALLSGRNHHAVGVGMTMETPLGFPGYTGRIPPSAALLPRVLRDAGYSTFAVGKWHLCPRGEYSASGPMDRWPLGMGFQRYYGFLGAETNQWAPELCRDNTFVDPPRSPEEGYHLTEDLTDEAIRMVRDQRQATPSKPWFCYFAPGAAHAPHHVEPTWSEAYRGRFDSGWEMLRQETFERQLRLGVVPGGTVLSGRPSWVPDWDQLSSGERTLFARYMEVFAGFMTHTDAQIGRLLEYLDRSGDLGHTLVLLLSDNGASGEGTPTGTLNESTAWLGQPETVESALGQIDDIGGRRAFNHYPWGWAWAGNTPLQLWKRYSWLGGVRTPLILSWADRLHDRGSLRRQFCHAVDLFPTILDAVGIDSPRVVDGVEQQRVDGSSLLPTFDDPEAGDPRPTQYFEMQGSRSIFHCGWKATTDYVSPLFQDRAWIPGSKAFEGDRWSLFHLDEDFAEAHDLAAVYPDRLAQLEDLWWEEARRNQVLPLFDGLSALSAMHPGEYRPPVAATYEPGGQPVNEGALPALAGGFNLTVDFEVDDRPLHGVVCALGDLNEGFALYFLEGRPWLAVISFGVRTRLEWPTPVPPGRHRLRVRHRPSRPGEANLFLGIDTGAEVSACHRALFAFPAVGTAAGGLLVGRDRGLAVTEQYRPPFPFSGSMLMLQIETAGPDAGLSRDDLARHAASAD